MDRYSDAGWQAETTLYWDSNASHKQAFERKGIRTDEAIVPGAQRMLRWTSEDSILQHDALPSYGDGPTFSDDLRPVHNSAARADRYIAIDNGIRGDEGGGINVRWGAGMAYEHVDLLLGTPIK